MSSSSKALVVNIINFVRGYEPRREMDLLTPVVNQLKLVRRHNLPATFLLQHDALIDERFSGLLRKNLNEKIEIGGWWEITESLAEKAGLEWRGRYSWDWHCNAGFSIAYDVEGRRKLVDAYMEDFQQVFGRWPESVGSWFIDAETLCYLSDQYKVVASCNCKDQYGTDGYTLWGGYWNQGYYPSRVNGFTPAQDAGSQIKLPIFRMLGSDPIDQYDIHCTENGQFVSTLEPAYAACGGNPDWIDWFFGQLKGQECLNFNYVQVGQENSFGWPAMEKGLRYQIELLSELVQDPAVRVEKLCDTGRWFCDNFKVTPPTAIAAEKETADGGKTGSAWFNSRFYRVNFYWDASGFRIRDIHLFRQDIPEKYLKAACTASSCKYETLPIVDGFLWSSPSQKANARIVDSVSGKPMIGSKASVTVQEAQQGVLAIDVAIGNGSNMRWLCREDSLEIIAPKDYEGRWGLELSWCKEGFDKYEIKIEAAGNKEIIYFYEGVKYGIRCDGCAEIKIGRTGILIYPEDNRLRFDMSLV